jgi:hypothetical protein
VNLESAVENRVARDNPCFSEANISLMTAGASGVEYRYKEPNIREIAFLLKLLLAERWLSMIPPNLAINQFDEAAYFAANPDLKNSIARLRNVAWEHYVRFGFKEGRPGVSDTVAAVVRRVLRDSPKQPPGNLIKRVHGSPDPGTFDEVGRNIALDIYLSVSRFIALDSKLRMLDFGCGCARVTRFVTSIFPDAITAGCESIARRSSGAEITSSESSLPLTPHYLPCLTTRAPSI